MQQRGSKQTGHELWLQHNTHKLAAMNFENWNASGDIEQAVEIQSTPSGKRPARVSNSRKHNDAETGPRRTSRKELSNILQGAASDMSFHVSATSMELAVEAVIEEGKKERRRTSLQYDDDAEPSLSGSDSSSSFCNSSSISIVDNTASDRLQELTEEEQTLSLIHI